MAYVAASVLRNEADNIAAKFDNVTPCVMDVENDHETLDHMIKDHDLVVRYISTMI